MLIIALCGKMGSGKDYIAHRYVFPLLQSLNIAYVHLCFADQIKVNAIAQHGADARDVFYEKTSASRKMLQTQGTELGRDVHGQDVWIRHFDAWSRLHESRGVRAIVTTDLRFQNEAEYVLDRHGIIVRVEAPLRNRERQRKENVCDDDSVTRHRSECELDQFDGVHYTVINDPSFDETSASSADDLVDWLRQRLYTSILLNADR